MIRAPRPFQEAAVDSAAAALAAAPRAQLISACGTGKTLMSVWVAQRMHARRVLAFAPSLAAIGNLLGTFQREGLADCRVVCSDDSIEGAHPEFEVTRDLDHLRSFWSGESDRVRVILCTYQSVGLLARLFGEPEVEAADLLIADEAHRLAGGLGEPFKRVLHADVVRAERRLFMTATPKVFGLGRSGELDVVASMDDAGLFGPVAHRISLAHAIELGVVADYQIDVLATTPDTAAVLAGDDAAIRTAAQAVAVRRAIAAGQINNGITFHTRLASAEAFAAAYNALGSYIPLGGTASYLSGDDPVKRRQQLVQALGAGGDLRLITSSRIFTEAMDAPCIDAAVIADSRTSTVDIVQIIGRALRLDPDRPDKVAHIVVPLVHPDGEPEPWASAEYEVVLNVLAALRSHDDRLAAALDDHSWRAGRRDALRERLNVEVQGLASADMLARLVENVRLVAHRRLADPVATLVGAITAYRAAHGHLRVHPQGILGGVEIGEMCQRVLRSGIRGGLTADDFARLGAVAPELDWVQNPGLLTPAGAMWRFAEREGHCEPNTQHREFGIIPLRKHIIAWEQQDIDGVLDPAVRAQLESITHWRWRRRAEREAVAELVRRTGIATVRLFGDTVIGDVDLRRLENRVRTAYKRGHLPKDEVEYRESLPGWSWTDAGQTWWSSYSDLYMAVREQGTFDYRRLGKGTQAWLRQALNDVRAGRAEADRVEALQGLPGLDVGMSGEEIWQANRRAPASHQALIDRFAAMVPVAEEWPPMELPLRERMLRMYTAAITYAAPAMLRAIGAADLAAELEKQVAAETSFGFYDRETWEAMLEPFLNRVKERVPRGLEDYRLSASESECVEQWVGGTGFGFSRVLREMELDCVTLFLFQSGAPRARPATVPSVTDERGITEYLAWLTGPRPRRTRAARTPRA